MSLTDLRLLAVFDAIHTTASVPRAADALGLGQPAVSVALARLQAHCADPLVVRTLASMSATPFAPPDCEVKQHWHGRHHHDPGNQWLRRTV